MTIDVAVSLVAAAVFAGLTFTPAIRRSESYAATLTPLASIMGSGFLISGPLLAGVAGNFSPLLMAGLLALALAIGSAIRFNIARESGGNAWEQTDAPDHDPERPDPSTEHRLHGGAADEATARHAADGSRRAAIAESLRRVGHWVLAVAYVISVTYYTKLLAQFSLDRFGLAGGAASTALTVGVLAAISISGTTFGLKFIERVERYAIHLNLAMIAALIFGLAWHDVAAFNAGTLSLPSLEIDDDWLHGLRVALGLLIVVQGFETSRYLGDRYAAAVRIRTMRAAQVVAAAVYLVFLTLLLPVMTPESAGGDAGVTAIVTLVGGVAAWLPAMVSVAAVGSQFSAAVADEAGCGGLIQQITTRWGKLSLEARTAYVPIGLATVALALSVDVMQVIAIASRAFAVYYAIECVVAVLHTFDDDIPHRASRRYGYAALAVLAATTAALGIPSG